MRRTKEDSEKTREAILEAAVDLFSSKGVEKSTLSEIANAANVTRGAVYWHFNNKIEIFEALHQRLHRPLADMIMQDLNKDHAAPLQQIEDLCYKMLLDLENDVQKRKILTLFLIRCDYTGDLAPYKKLNDQEKNKKLTLLSHYFERARERGALPEGADPDMLALSVCCYMKGIVVEYLNDPDSSPVTGWGSDLIKLFFKGLRLAV